MRSYINYLETRKSNFLLRKTDASSEVPSNEAKFETSTAKDSAAAIAIAGAPRTTISLIASLAHMKKASERGGHSIFKNILRHHNSRRINIKVKRNKIFYEGKHMH